jgi:hypothetical protein
MRGGESFLEERFNFSIKHNLLHIKQNKKRVGSFVQDVLITTRCKLIIIIITTTFGI